MPLLEGRFAVVLDYFFEAGGQLLEVEQELVENAEEDHLHHVSEEEG